jgi:uncharacterized protein YceK
MSSKLLNAAMVSLLVIYLSGCGTYLARIENGQFSRDNDFYKGVNADIKMLGDDAGYLSMVCYLTIFCPIVFLASIPVDLMADTILVPHDYSRATRRRDMTYKKVLAGKTYGSIKIDFGTSIENTKNHAAAHYEVWYGKGNRSLVLRVDDVVLFESTLVAVVPYIEGYMPGSMYAYSPGGDYMQSVGVSISRSRSSDFKITSDNAVVPLQSGEVLTCSGNGKSQTVISITPYLNTDLQIFLRRDSSGGPSLRC